MSEFDVPTFKGLARGDLIRARARLLGNTEFQKAVAAGDQEARDAIRDLSEAMLANGGAALSPDEHKISGYE